MKQLDDNSVDCIIADPPYFEVMIKDYLGNRYDWDNQWKDFNVYLNWCKQWFFELKRILKNNGSIYIFSDDKISAYLQVRLDTLFHLENNIIWVKPNNMTIKGWKRYRCYSPITERILFYSKESRNTNLENKCYAENVKTYEPIIEYMIEQKRKIQKYFGFKTDKEFNEYINEKTNTKSVVSRHYFTYSQWSFPTKKIYEKLQNVNDEVFKKEYEVFKKEYEVLKKEYESKRRCFSPEENYTDVWTFNITSSHEKTYHPTQKPIKLISRIVETSTRKNDLVLDPFIGSGTTAVACKKTSRQYIGFESSKEYYDIAQKRLDNVVLSKRLGDL